MTAGNWRSTLGGACSAAGTSLMGIGVMSQFNGSSTATIKDITLVGFILLAAGQFFGHLFAADARSVAALNDKVDATNDKVDATTEALRTGDTTLLAKTDVPTK